VWRGASPPFFMDMQTEAETQKKWYVIHTYSGYEKPGGKLICFAVLNR